MKERAENLGKSAYEKDEEITTQKSIQLSKTDVEKVKEYLMNNQPPDVQDCSEDEMIHICFRKVDGILRKYKQRDNKRSEYVTCRWLKILQSNDAKMIWKSIGWNGELKDDGLSKQKPTDKELKMHFEKLLNPEDIDQRCNTHVANGGVDIPQLDCPITEKEVTDAINATKSNKGYIGIDSAFLKILPMSWISWIVYIFNRIFKGAYPKVWCASKLIILFKKGCKLLCGNYRGISITDTLAKLYDRVLFSRLRTWIKIDKCQAGSQEGRGCTEQMLALRLLIDYAKCKRKKLFICFIDFSKAYDRVSRPILFQLLAKLGCGRTMLRALQAMYDTTKMILRTVIINAKRGIKQGGSTSGLFFILYMNPLAELLRESCPNDDYLADLHSLMLMDDTAILATTRETMLKRYDALVAFCEKYEMEINEDKTKFMVINGTEEDKISFCKGGITVKNTEKYVYLGNPFSATGNMSVDLQLHADMNTKHLNKFNLFCVKNQCKPFPFKRMVFDSVLTAKILYGCESWLTENYKCIETLYMGAIKGLLGVRKQTPNNIVLLESGIASLRCRVLNQQKRFLLKKLQDDEEPLTKVFKMCQQENTKGYRILQKTIHSEIVALDDIRETVCADTTSTKLKTYKTLNPDLSVCGMYKEKHYIPDYVRAEVTKFRTSSHQLNIERGRWSRIPPEQRYCSCDNESVQDEIHVLYSCPITKNLREKFHIDETTPLKEIFTTANVYFVYGVMKLFK